MISPGLLAPAIHALLHDCPIAVVGNDEAVQVEVETVLHRRAVDFGDEAARAGELGAVQIPSVVMIALLAICRKVIILDLTETDALHILALAAAILALGLIYWLIGVRDREGDEAA